MTAQEIAQAIADNAKSGKWLSCTFQLANPEKPGATIAVGVKAFGKWVQRVECGGLVDGIPEQKTLKALKEQTVETIESMVKALGFIPGAAQALPAVKVHCRFEQVKTGASFESNGNIVRKQSSRTGCLLEFGRTFYYGKDETVTVKSLDDVDFAGLESEG